MCVHMRVCKTRSDWKFGEEERVKGNIWFLTLHFTLIQGIKVKASNTTDLS